MNFCARLLRPSVFACGEKRPLIVMFWVECLEMSRSCVRSTLERLREGLKEVRLCSRRKDVQEDGVHVSCLFLLRRSSSIVYGLFI